MNINLKPSSDRMYLHRDYTDDNNDIFVEFSLHQHHIDGIRFLYKQYVKKKPGVIVNNPLGYGNSLQVALFLGAVTHQLTKPILILCEQSEELNWLEIFQKHTQCYNVGVDAPSPFVRKAIFINSLERLELFWRRDWAVLVVDHDGFLAERALQPRFRADFKIWITPQDMKNNLETFSSIYKWIFPSEKLNVQEFKAKPGDRMDAVSKAILLDAFMEDIVCRTTLQTPFENPFEKSAATPRKTSKKNKDATGTKIKRSKKLLDGGNTSKTSQSSDFEAGASAAKVPRTEAPAKVDFSVSNFSRNEEDTKFDDKDNKSDIESFIRDEPPIKFDPFNEFDNISRNSQESRTEFMEDEPIFGTADRLNRLLESNVPMDIVENPECCFIDSDTNSDSDSLLPLPKTFDDASQHSDISDYAERQRTTPDFLTDNILNEIKEEMSESINSDTFKEDFKPEPLDDDCKGDEESAKGLGEAGKDKEDPNRGNKEPDERQEELDKVDEKPDLVIEDTDKVKEEPAKVKKDSDKVTESSSKHDLDAKLREMDERAFKKFQGSILDSLF